MGQRAGLARAGAGDDQERAVDDLGGGALLGVEAGEQALSPAGPLSRSLSPAHREPG